MKRKYLLAIAISILAAVTVMIALIVNTVIKTVSENGWSINVFSAAIPVLFLVALSATILGFLEEEE